jgi:leucine dehydrogenase
MFDNPSFDAHERVVYGFDAQTGLRAIVAVHSTARGPGAGGCRFWQYRSSEEALTDALRLSRGMSYKNAMAGLPLGGGKAVVILDPRRPKTPEQLQALGLSLPEVMAQLGINQDGNTTKENGQESPKVFSPVKREPAPPIKE